MKTDVNMLISQVFKALKSCIFKKLNFSWTSPYFRVSCPFNEPFLELLYVFCPRKLVVDG